MNTFEYAVWLGEQTLCFLIFLWPVSFALLAFIAVSGYWTFEHQKQSLRRQHLGLLFPAASVPLAWLVGSVFVKQPRYESLLLIILSLLIVFSICILVALRRARLFALSVLLWILWCAFWSSAVAAMSITDDWL